MKSADHGVHLIKYRRHQSHRAHFAVYAPACPMPGRGVIIEARGTPIVGYTLSIQRFFDLASDTRRWTAVPLCADPVSIDRLCRVAEETPSPGKSENFLDPVDGV